MEGDADSIEEEFRKCSRLVPGYKPEDADSRKFWFSVFKNLEDQSKIPSHRRLAILQETFSEAILKKILKILPHAKTPDDEIAKSKVLPASRVDYERPERQSFVSKSAIFRKSLREDVCVQIEDAQRIDFRKILTTSSKPGTSYANMYTKFLDQPEQLSNKWRPKPPLTFEGMDLNEKCEAITLRIATDFVEWLKGIGGDEQTNLDVPVILNLFEIGFNAHAADSLAVKIKELNAVTKAVANARYMPEASYTAQLYKQLFRDINAVRRKEDMFAFGTMLPPEMRPAPQKDNIASKWIQNKRVPERIANMAVVWEGIEHLRSTYGYCKWLMDHPQIEPPIYLREKGLLQEILSTDEHNFSFDELAQEGGATPHE